MSNRNLFGSTPIQVPNRSGFDLSHENMLTLKCGQLVPVMTDLLIPGDRVSVGSAFEVQLPPMATDFYGRVRFHMCHVLCLLLFLVFLFLCSHMFVHMSAAPHRGFLF